MTPTDFVRYLRLHRAKELLEKHSGPIAEVADACGFVNHSYFSKTFKDLFGVPPSEISKT